MKEQYIEIGTCNNCGKSLSISIDELQPNAIIHCDCGTANFITLNPAHYFKLKTSPLIKEHTDYGFAIRYACPECDFAFSFPRIEGRMGIALVHTEQSLIKEDIITQKKMPFVSEKIHASNIDFRFVGFCFDCNTMFARNASVQLKDLLVYPGTDMKFTKKLTYYVLPIQRARKYFTIKSGNFKCSTCERTDIVFDWQEKITHACPNCNVPLDVTPRWSPVKV